MLCTRRQSLWIRFIFQPRDILLCIIPTCDNSHKSDSLLRLDQQLGLYRGPGIICIGKEVFSTADRIMAVDHGPRSHSRISAALLRSKVRNRACGDWRAMEGSPQRRFEIGPSLDSMQLLYMDEVMLPWDTRLTKACSCCIETQQ